MRARKLTGQRSMRKVLRDQTQSVAWRKKDRTLKWFQSQRQSLALFYKIVHRVLIAQDMYLELRRF